MFASDCSQTPMSLDGSRATLYGYYRVCYLAVGWDVQVLLGRIATGAHPTRGGKAWQASRYLRHIPVPTSPRSGDRGNAATILGYRIHVAGTYNLESGQLRGYGESSCDRLPVQGQAYKLIDPSATCIRPIFLVYPYNLHRI